jgi:diaminohydroxyphosphoribosylaminopyrimidine deaminase/5-amino-6-(5-phosphoribosylamino)uracil reductase
MIDPNPLNRGKGIKELRRKGIKVKVGLLEDEAKKINEPFIKFIIKKMPLVAVKVAQSLDGKIATFTGNSKWISGTKSRNYVQKIRNQIDAIMVGVNTVIKDNPRLSYRGPNPRKDKPIKIIVDSYLRVPLKAKVFSKLSPGPVIMAVSNKAPLRKIKILENKGVKILKFKVENNLINLKSLIKKLAKLEITNLLIEGGGETIAQALKQKVVDKVLFFIAPKIIGGRSAISSCEGDGVRWVRQAVKLEKMEVRPIGKDLLVEAYVHGHN